MRLVLITTSVLISLIFIELFLYIDDFHPEYKRFRIILDNVVNEVNDDPNIFFKDKKQNKIVFIGDSFTVNKVCAHNKKDFVNIIKNKFTDENKSFYNFSSLADNPIQYLAMTNFIKKEARNIILVLYYNDIFIGKKTCESLKNIPNNSIDKDNICEIILKEKKDTSNDNWIKKVDNIFENRIRIWRLLKESLINIEYFADFFHRSSWKNMYQDPSSPQNKIFILLLKEIQRVAEKNNINLIITYFPDVKYLDLDNPQINDWKKFVQIANDNNIIIHDPWEYFLKNSDKKNMVWSLIDDHPNCEANKIMSNYIANNLLKKIQN